MEKITGIIIPFKEEENAIKLKGLTVDKMSFKKNGSGGSITVQLLFNKATKVTFEDKIKLEEGEFFLSVDENDNIIGDIKSPSIHISGANTKNIKRVGTEINFKFGAAKVGPGSGKVGPGSGK